MTYLHKIARLGLTLALLAPLSVVPAFSIDFGDNASTWANDGECDDPRFEGTGMADILLDEDRFHDANDCERLLNKGRITEIPVSTKGTGFNFGDNASTWANDGECDDPRFGGPGVADILLDEDLAHDANDCRTLLDSGQIFILGDGNASSNIDFGDDTSAWANDGECDDPRFSGPGAAATLLDSDLGHDAADCQYLYQSNQIDFIGAVSVSGGSNVANIEACPFNALGLSQSLTCDCTAQAANAGGSIWGTGIYTSDSDICRAAVHAGQISTSGGRVQIFPLPGQDSYQSSKSNGVSSSGWGGYGESFSF